MKVALFIPCYIDQFYPDVAIATLQLLEKSGVTVDYPLEQTCCGQPLANSGFEKDAIPIYHHFIRQFHDYDYIVAPSGSCVLQVKEHYQTLKQTPEVKKVRSQIYEICEFLTDIVKVRNLNVYFPYKVGLHVSCHGLRGLHLAQSSELRLPPFSKMKQLLQLVDKINLVKLARQDECCGFGGTFSIFEEAVSVKMGKDRIADHQAQGVEVITGNDMSCLMHLEGILKRQKSPIKIKHIVEILNGTSL